MTREDLKKIEKSMKRPEFMGLLNEYMIEISDPKNKIEYDQYLRQMENEKELPKHMKIVELTPKFCFRTLIVSQKNKKHEMKFFINMCETKYLE
jgi:dynein assembly factor 2, axonemal